MTCSTDHFLQLLLAMHGTRAKIWVPGKNGQFRFEVNHPDDQVINENADYKKEKVLLPGNG